VLNDMSIIACKGRISISLADLDTGRLRYQKDMNINTKLSYWAKPGGIGTTTAFNIT